MGRTARITIVVAPFAFAVLPLAALLMTPGGTAEPVLPQATDRTTEAAYHADADCPLEPGGI